MIPEEDDLSDFPVGYPDVRPLGRGAFGEVYAAVDARGRAAALKVMAPEAAARPEAVWQFLGEYRRLARLDHPAFPAAFEEGSTPEGRPFYSMALASGDEPAAASREPAEVRRVLLAVAEALAYMHGLGYVHNDLKLENLRLAPDGHVWVLDVGLMAPIGQKREAVAGTPTHMAPEVLRKAPVAPGADLYALGVLGYELWTGRTPYNGGPGELARAHLQASPPALPAGDPALAALLVGLLAKEVDRRPPSALAVLGALGRDVDPALAAGPLPGLQGGGFIGRGPVLAAWQATLAEPEAGWLAVAGGPGEGKSRLLDELRLAAQLAGRTWVGAACAGGAPGGPVRALVAQALAAAGLQAEGVARAWLDGALTPELADMEPAARKVTLFAAAARALAEAAERLGGLALGLDDWHRTDDASRDFLDFLRRSPLPAPLAWAIALDPVQAPAERALPIELASLALGPFDAEDAAAHVAARLGAPAPAGLLEALAGSARGNPLLVDLALEHLVARKALRREPAGWAYDAVAASTAGLPAGLAEAWRARYERLDPAAKRLVAAAALAAPAGSLAVPLLAQAVQLAGSELASAVDALAAEGVLAIEGGFARFLAGGAEALFSADLDAPTRAAWTTAWAAALLGPAQDLPGAPFDALAQAAALAIAGDAPGARVLAAEAGRRAMAMSAPAEALRLLGAAEARMP
ncbi:MAG: serine/threonine protein kinase, partial [Cyanobacteria bacterium RYN_339]|nr:serine/threonine protein kinase [Cyanobacteria bacterium RYN_339]